MSRSVELVRLPVSGSALFPLPRVGKGKAVIELEVPPGITVLELRGIAADPDASGIGGLVAESPDLVGCTQLPVPGGVWIRLNLAAGDGPRQVRLTLPSGAGLRHLLAWVPQTGTVGASLSFSGLDGPPPAPVPTSAPAVEVAPFLALLRAGKADPALAALRRLPTDEVDALAPILLAALADSPGETPPDLLPFLMLLARD